MILFTRKSKPMSLQVSYIRQLPAGDSTFTEPVLVKNITDENITASVKMSSGDDFIETIFYPGWNPELIIAIKDVEADTLQIGI